MISRCDVTQAAVELSVQLEAYTIPDDFEATGDRRQLITAVRDRYTNYRTLLANLPACPHDCPLLAGNLSGQSCSSYNIAREMLETEALRLALATYKAWLGEKRTGVDSNKVRKPQDKTLSFGW